ncbi:response regulator transcription factor [Proteiniclasticum sp. QWL-01]|uniref:response regulator transcription factor n=1 Tax=Proteiniclasticum sp. QWL-01 TaxID=3036945 RepID=UPI00241064C3|nr:response regulator transcription factor [Proteiniclasticum sp. QWL-01]WFF71769.1 response regulator transcription factor [Proteiniclasticum sp. QWL-01]
MAGLKVLLVDDEAGILDLIREYMAKGDYEADEASDGLMALEMLTLKNYDIVVLDIMMPGMDGWTAARSIRSISDVPIIMLSARGEEYDKLLGFEMGIDDYLVKPFSPRELLARIRAITSRKAQAGLSWGSWLAIGELRIDPDSRRVLLGGEAVSLTPKEFDLLYFLAKHPGKAFSREHLLTAVWGLDFQGDSRTVDTHIKQLRERLQEERRLIVTVWGHGYRLDPEVKP